MAATDTVMSFQVDESLPSHDEVPLTAGGFQDQADGDRIVTRVTPQPPVLQAM
jgi:hypothetical protein